MRLKHKNKQAAHSKDSGEPTKQKHNQGRDSIIFTESVTKKHPPLQNSPSPTHVKPMTFSKQIVVFLFVLIRIVDNQHTFSRKS